MHQEITLQENEMAKCILQDMSDGVVTVDAHGTILSINTAAQSLLGFAVPINIGDKFASVFLENEKNDRLVQCVLDAIYSNSKQNDVVLDYYTDTQVFKKLHLKITCLRGKSAATGIVIILTDVTFQEQFITYQKDISIMIAAAVCFYCVYFTVCFVFAYFFNDTPLYLQKISFLTFIFSVVLSWTLHRYTSYMPKPLIKREHFREDIMRGLGIVLVVSVLLVGFKAFSLKIGLPFFDVSKPFFNFSALTLADAYYPITAFLQEFIMRCALHDGLNYILNNKYWGVSVATSGILLGAMHLHYGMLYAVGAFILMGLLGVLYQKNKSLVEVTVIHYFLGELTAILGYFL